jgi:hypothetical protein
MSFTKLWSVMAQNATAVFIIDGSATPPSSYLAIPVYAADPSGVAHGLIVRAGIGTFFGNASGLVEAPVAHGMPAAPLIGIPIPGTNSSGLAWTAEVGQYQSPDGGTLYFIFTAPSGGTFSNGVEYFYTWIAFGFM